MTDRHRIPTRTLWADAVGYSRAVRVGDHIYVSGTAPMDGDKIVAPRDPYLQAKRCLEIIVAALREAGAGPEHVVRTRLYSTDASFWEPIGRAHAEVFGEVRPSTTFLVVAGLIDPNIVVEIEADAVL